MTAYYNEFDPYAAQWLRNLIAAGEIAPGDVDERSIEDVRPTELAGYTQCHFFAGIGAWSYALRRAGWPDDRPIWTGSCPCQPFSAAGKGDGFADERHLWPAFYHLISQCRPPVILGEQVASKAIAPWIDLVHADLEAMGYAFGGIPFPAAGVGTPGIRDRAYWMADAISHSGGRKAPASDHRESQTNGPADRAGGCSGASGRLADTDNGGRLGRRASEAGDGRDTPRLESERLCNVERVADASGQRWLGRQGVSAGGNDGRKDAGRQQGDHGPVGFGKAGIHVRRREQPGAVIDADTGAGPTNGFWRAADWLLCRDGRWRPVEPGTFPLAHGTAARVGSRGPDWQTPAGAESQGHRVGRLRGYGNAINAEAAVAFIQTVMECRP